MIECSIFELKKRKRDLLDYLA